MFDKYVRTILKDTVIIYNRYDKYLIYDKDTKIINYLCKYKHLNNSLKIDSKYLNYILNKLNINNINYIVIDIINNNDVIYEKEFIINKYKEYYKKSKRYLKNRVLIDKIMINLKQLDNDKLITINNCLEGYCVKNI